MQLLILVLFVESDLGGILKNFFIAEVRGRNSLKVKNFFDLFL